MVKKVFLFLFFCHWLNNSLSTPCPSNKDIVEWCVTPPINLPKWLSDDIFFRVSPIVVRDVSSLPSLLYEIQLQNIEKSIDSLSEWYGNISIFIDSIPSGVAFGDEGNSFTNLVGLGDFTKNNPDLFDLLFSQAPYASINFPLIGNLFDEVILSQQRVGITFTGDYRFLNSLIISAQIPFLYRINYISCSEESAAVIAGELTSLNSGSSTDMIRKTMVSDSIGFDPLIFSVGSGSFFENTLYFAGKFSLPVGLSLKQGLIGGNFSATHNAKSSFIFSNFLKNSIFPTSSCADSSMAKDDFLSLFSLMLSKNSDSTYNLPFIKRGYGIGLDLRLIAALNEHFSLITNFSGMYRIPFNSYRYFLQKASKSGQTIDIATLTEAEATAILGSFDNQLIDRMILKSETATISQGNEIQCTTFVFFREDLFSGGFGVDFWYKDEEVVDFLNLLPQNVLVSNQGNSMQIQLIGSFMYKCMEKEKLSMYIDASAGVSLFSQSIGKSNNLSISLGVLY